MAETGASAARISRFFALASLLVLFFSCQGASSSPAPEKTCSPFTVIDAATTYTFDDGFGDGDGFTPSVKCRWLIHAESGFFINIKFSEIRLSFEDTLEIFDGYETRSDPVIHLNASTNTGVVPVWTGDIASVVLTSGPNFHSRVHAGFNAMLAQLPSTPTPSPGSEQARALRRSKAALAKPAQDVQPAREPARGHKYEKALVRPAKEAALGLNRSSRARAPMTRDLLNHYWQECYREVNSTTINLSGIGALSDSYLSCTWLVKTSAPFIRMRVDTFSINDIPLIQVLVYGGRDDLNSPRLLLLESDLAQPVDYVFPSPIFVTYNQYAWEGGWGGFEAVLEAVHVSPSPGPTPTPKCYQISGSDVTYSAIGTKGYSSFQQCSWLIEATGAAPFIHMNFTSFSTEGGYDFVTIYGGSDDSAPQLAKLSGNLGDLGAIDYYFASPIFVKFAADAGLTSNGFDAVLESVDQTPTPAPSPTPSASPIPLCYQTSDSAEISYSTIGTTSDYDKTCTWLVETTSAPFVRISVPYNLDMQYLEIFGGRDDSAPTLAKWRYYILAGDYFFPAPIFIKFYAYGYWESNLHAELAAVEVSPTPTPTPTPNPPPNCLQESNLPNITISSFGSRNTHRGDVCSWLIESTDKPFIHLTFSNVFLNYDLQSVTIYGGYNADSPQLKYLTGIYDSPVEYIFPSPVFVRFQVAQYEWYTPDASNGFDATVEALETRPQMACYQTSGSTGINYSNVGVDGPVSGYNQGCSWLVETTGAPFVQLTFTSFTLNIYGYYDQISVYGGTDDTAPLLEYIEGGDYDRLQRTYIFPSPFFIKYTTDPGQQGSVFTAALEPLLASPTPTPTPAPKCYQTSGSDITYSAIGTRGYDNDQQCSWLIEAPGAAPFIHITFTSFYTQRYDDVVTIYGGSDDSAPQLAQLSGNLYAVDYYFAAPIFVMFRSNWYADWYDGFDAVLEAVQTPPTPTPTPLGCFSATNSSQISYTTVGVGEYQNDADCSWLVTTAMPMVRGRFTKLDTEGCCDIITVYSGNDASGTMLGRFSGCSTCNTELPSFYGASPIFIQFKSDFSETATGFAMELEAFGDATGGSFGDPHIKTLGGLIVTYAGDGDVTMMAAPSMGLRYLSRFSGSTSYPASWATALALQCQTGGQVLEMYAMPDEDRDTDIIIDGKLSKWLEIGEDLSGVSIRVDRTAGGHYSVACNDNSLALDVVVHRAKSNALAWMDVAVRMNDKLYGKAAGLIGSYDGDVDNDVAFAHGKVLYVPKEKTSDGYLSFTEMGDIFEVEESWRVQPSETLFSRPHPDISLPTHGDRRHLLASMDHPVRNEERMDRARKLCSGAGIKGPYIETCAFDLAVTGDESHIDKHKRAMSFF